MEVEPCPIPPVEKKPVEPRSSPVPVEVFAVMVSVALESMRWPRRPGFTSGAFYAHFKSKADAFRAAMGAGMRDLQQGVASFQERYGRSWRARFVEFYMGDRRTCDLGDSCALQSLSADVSRADDETRALFEEIFREILDGVASGLEGRPRARRDEAIALLALLAGGVTLARAVSDSALSDEIGAAVRKAAAALAHDPP